MHVHVRYMYIILYSWYLHGVLIFMVDLAVTKIFTHEN